MADSQQMINKLMDYFFSPRGWAPIGIEEQKVIIYPLLEQRPLVKDTWRQLEFVLTTLCKLRRVSRTVWRANIFAATVSSIIYWSHEYLRTIFGLTLGLRADHEIQGLLSTVFSRFYWDQLFYCRGEGIIILSKRIGLVFAPMGFTSCISWRKLSHSKLLRLLTFRWLSTRW